MTQKSKLTREKMIDSAKKLFFEKGLIHTSQQEIADDAGVNRGLIYHYFGSKEQMARIIFEHFDKSFFTTLNSRFFSSEPDKVFVSIVQGRIILNFLLTHEQMKRFYMEIILENVVTDYSIESVMYDFRKECRYLGLKFNDEEQRLYSTILASVENRMMSTRIIEEFTLPVEEIITIYNRIHLRILGLTEEQIESIIQRAIEVSRRITFVNKDYFKVTPEQFIYHNEE
ncbi:MAG: TetR/AcrR family transcriptional regulator [Lachnospiraceae bacterium]